MALVGTKSAMLIMREAFYGTTRFDDFARRVGVTKAATSARLSELVEVGLLDEAALPRARSAQSRRVRAHRVRHRLHAGGVGDVRVGPQARRRHAGCGSPTWDCGAEATVEIRCADGHEVPADELAVRLVRR